jgi:type IV secretory pathway VirD2 relaxase
MLHEGNSGTGVLDLLGEAWVERHRGGGAGKRSRADVFFGDAPKLQKQNRAKGEFFARAARSRQRASASSFVASSGSSRSGKFGFGPVAGLSDQIRLITLDDDERSQRRNGGGAGGQGIQSGSPQSKGRPGFVSGGVPSSKQKIADGFRPTVIKVVSFAKGGKRAGATAAYVQRDGVALETDDMRLLRNHDEVQAEIDHWTHSFDSRKATDDVVTIQVKVAGLKNTHDDLKLFMRAVDAAFEGHHWALGEPLSRDGSLQARVVTVMAGTKERFRVDNDLSLADKSRTAMLERMEQEGIATDRVTLIAGRPGHGVEALAYRLSLLAENGQGAMTDKKAPINSRLEARNLAREWKRDLHSFEGRDTMHLVVSAKGDTDMDAFKSAVRAYLHESFRQNKFMWGVHSDKKENGQGHIHAHAVVAMRGQDGTKLHPNIKTFKVWRETFAEKAQAEGLKIVATAAAERASSQSYGAKDKAIVDAANTPRQGREKQDIAYARQYPHVVAKARHRMAVAKINPARFAVTEKQRKQANSDLAEWRSIAGRQTNNPIATENVIRLGEALAAGAAIRDILAMSKGETSMANAQAMSDTLARMNRTVEQASDSLSEKSRQAFVERATKVLTSYAVRVDLQRLAEQGIKAVATPQVAKIVSIAGDRLLDRARQIEGRERREAEAARKDAEAAQSNASRSAGKSDPVSSRQTAEDQQDLQRATRGLQKETREAQAASKAARDLVSKPGAKIDPTAAKSSEGLKELKLEQARTLDEIRAAAQKEVAKPTGQKIKSKKY